MKQLFNISNDAVIEPARSVLLIEMGENYCCLIILKVDGFEAERLVYYESEGEEKFVKEVFAAHEEFNRNFSEVLINYSFSQSVTVPSKYYDLAQGRQMLRLMYGDELGETVLSEHLPEWQLYNIYEVPKQLYGWLSMRFHSGKYWHSYTSSLKHFPKTGGSDMLVVDFKTGHFSLVLIKAGKFQLAQTFDYTEPADVLYYLVKVCNNFALPQRELQLVLSGFLEKQSMLYRELYNYFVNVSFNPGPDFVRLKGQFDEYPGYFFSSLLNLAACVS